MTVGNILWILYFQGCNYTHLINSLLRWRWKQRALNGSLYHTMRPHIPKDCGFHVQCCEIVNILFILNEVPLEWMTFKIWIKINHALFVVPRWDMRIDRYDMQMKSVNILESGWKSCDFHPAISFLSNVWVAKPLRVRYKIAMMAYLFCS